MHQYPILKHNIVSLEVPLEIAQATYAVFVIVVMNKDKHTCFYYIKGKAL